MKAAISYRQSWHTTILLLLSCFFTIQLAMASEMLLEDQILACENSGGDHDPESVVMACDQALASALLTAAQKASAHANRGRSLYSTGNFDRAIEDFDVALRLDPLRVDVRRDKALAFVAIGRVRQAQRDILELIEQAAPNQEDVLLDYVRELSTTSAPHRHGLLARRLIEVVNPAQDKNPQVLEKMAAAYAADRDYDIAVRLQYRALQLAEQNGENDLSGYRDRFKLYKSNRALVCPDLPECW